MTATERLRLLRERGGQEIEYPDNRAGRRARARMERKHRKGNR